MDWLTRNQKYTMIDETSGFTLNFAGMKFTEEDLSAMEPLFERAVREMARIEAGEIKNPDEKRKVTHFTDRADYLAGDLFREVEEFAAQVRAGKLLSGAGKPFTAVVINGIGGSALGPQLMQFAINGPYWNELGAEQRKNGLKIYFLDNTDSAELADLIAVMDPASTLHLTISKSGGTQETRNNMIALEDFYAAKGLDFARFSCAITMKGSLLEQHAIEHKWLRCFEMAESIGGRTSETSIVGHLPAALTGIDFAAFLRGACHMDQWTRETDYRKNPAYLLSAMWYIAGSGKGDRNMVIVPYSDRLVLLSRYLQQLVMESLGKEFDLDGKVVHQGLSVFGNKGGTDAHAFIQQLNDGRDDFFATFIEVLKDARKVGIAEGIAMGDYLHGFEEGLAAALHEKGRQLIKITVDTVNPFALGMLIALYERAVAAYAEYVNINAFHQPGVQAYKLAAKGVLSVRSDLMSALQAMNPESGTACELAVKAGLGGSEVVVAGLLAKAAANCESGKLSRRFDAGRGDWLYTVGK